VCQMNPSMGHKRSHFHSCLCVVQSNTLLPIAPYLSIHLVERYCFSWERRSENRLCLWKSKKMTAPLLRVLLVAFALYLVMPFGRAQLPDDQSNAMLELCGLFGEAMEWNCEADPCLWKSVSCDESGTSVTYLLEYAPSIPLKLSSKGHDAAVARH